jgi:hypothetical protein
MRMADVIYMPQAKWKSGERRAFATSAAARSGRIAPVFKVTPAGGFDPEEQRVLSTTEYLRRFGRQLADACGRRIAFIDAELIDDEFHREAITTHPLTELLERSRLEGANAAPVYGRSSSQDYLDAVRRFLLRDDKAISCIRIGLHELETISSAEELRAAATEAGGRPSSTVILIDGGPLAIDDPDDLAHLLAGHVARLISRDTWLRVFWSATTYPDKPKLKAGMLGRFKRRDWELYEAILRMRQEFSVVPMFSDYMLEYPAEYVPLRVAPTAKLSYSSETEYLHARGRSTRYEEKYRNIFPVAAQLAGTPEFKGPAYSMGNSYIAQLATGEGKTGNASMWRWCSTDHHLAMVNQQLTTALGLPSVIEEIAMPAEQMMLV